MTANVTTPLTDERLAEIEAREQTATPGPWGWRGHISQSVELRTLHSGGLRIISSHVVPQCIDWTAEHGVFLREGDSRFEGPCATCRAAYESGSYFTGDPPTCERAGQHDTVWTWHPKGFIRPVNDWAKAEVLEWSDHMYRDDVKDTTHPDCEFIAKAREDVPALLAEVRRLRALLGELITVTPPWAKPEIRFAISCLHCKAWHTTDEDGNPDLYPAEVLTDPGLYFNNGEWFLHEGKPCCLNCWEAAFCEECLEPIHAWEKTAVDNDRKCTAHPGCLTAEELATATVMPALEAAKTLHEAWAERTAARNVELEKAGGEPR